MKKHFPKILSLVLIVTLLLVNTQGVAGSDATSKDLFRNYVTAEQKVKCEATLEENFADDTVIVLLNKRSSTIVDTSKSSLRLKAYGPCDFSEVNCVAVLEIPFIRDQIDEKLAATKPANLAKFGETITADDLGVDVQKFNRYLLLVLEEKGKENVLIAIRELEKREEILWAGPNYIGSACTTNPQGTYSGQQWALGNLNLPDAWDITTGNNAIRVGVLDTGIQGNHPDLAGRIANGSVHGDFSLCYANGSLYSYTPVSNPTDLKGHGTHVAGIIGANGTGVSGVCMNGVTLVSLKVMDDSGNFTSFNVTAAVLYATSIYNSAQRINILNFSGGWAGGIDYNLYTAINDFPGLFVCSAGNNNSNNNLIAFNPANYRLDNLISVGALTLDNGTVRRAELLDTLWPTGQASNWGSLTVDIFAPGTNIIGIYPTAVYSSGYGYASGTSQAAPHVAGVAALLLSKYPSYTAVQLKRVIMETGTPTSGLQCVSGGRLDAYKALSRSVTVNGSYATYTGAGSYTSGTTVVINAGTRGGYVFTGWTVNVGGVSLANSSSPVTTFTKLGNNSNVIVTANWAPDPNFNGYVLYDSVAEIGSASRSYFFWGSQVATGNYFRVAAPAMIYLNGPWVYEYGSPIYGLIGWWGDDSANWYVDVYGGYGGAICIWVEN